MDPFFLWGTSLMIHSSSGVLLPSSILLWGTFLKIHSSFGILLYRSILPLGYFSQDPLMITWQLVYLPPPIQRPKSDMLLQRLRDSYAADTKKSLDLDNLINIPKLATTINCNNSVLEAVIGQIIAKVQVGAGAKFNGLNYNVWWCRDEEFIDHPSLFLYLLDLSSSITTHGITTPTPLPSTCGFSTMTNRWQGPRESAKIHGHGSHPWKMPPWFYEWEYYTCRVQHSEMIAGTHDLMQRSDDGWICKGSLAFSGRSRGPSRFPSRWP